ncbi:MAG TPA: glycosyltransferase family 2 protein [Nitrososphaeraceae archaeon]|nr:glycosyltransferase family 2 protein [Nitrososphaeraceae archaeon]
MKQSPKLESYDRYDGLRNKNSYYDIMPKVSIIVPVRNEEKYISKCLDSLLNQKYSNFEIIVINDSSSDGTWNIIQRYTENCEQSLEAINAGPRPDGWIGKSWACYQGYLKATGDIFMFTDADTIHSQNALSLAVGHLINQKLDALTAIPRLVCEDFWTKITLPVVWSISYVRYSPLRANNPNTTTGYFFGSFYVIFRRVYEAVGTHEAVKGEIVEDGALGGIVKKEKFRLKVVRGEHHIRAIWARDLSSLWHGLRRLMIPLYYQDKIHASVVTTAVFFLLLTPFFLFPFSISYLAQLSMIGNPISINDFRIWDAVLIGFSLMATGLVVLSSAIQSKHVLYNSPMYSLGAPMASFIISLGFISSIIDAKKSGIVKWKGRKYAIGNTTQHPLH